MTNYDPLQTANYRNKKYSTSIYDVLESILFDLGHTYISNINNIYYITDYKGAVILYTCISGTKKRWQLAYPDTASYSYPILPEKWNITVGGVKVMATLFIDEDVIFNTMFSLPIFVMP